MGPIERRWQQSTSRRKAMLAMARVAAASPLLPSALAAQLDPRPLSEHKRAPGLDEMMNAFDFEPVMFANVPLAVYDYTAHGDGSEFTLRRNRQAFDWVDLAAGQADRSGVRRSVVRDPRHEDEISDHGRADGDDGAAASGRRDRHASRGDRRVEHADDRQPQHEHDDRSHRGGRHRPAVVAVLSVAEPRREPRDRRRRAGRRDARRRRHRRSAGVVLRTHAAGSQSRRPRRRRCGGRAAARGGRGARAGGCRDADRRRALSRAAGTPLVHVAATSTTFARS